jgi:hypothetical protein
MREAQHVHLGGGKGKCSQLQMSNKLNTWDSCTSWCLCDTFTSTKTIWHGCWKCGPVCWTYFMLSGLLGKDRCWAQQLPEWIHLPFALTLSLYSRYSMVSLTGKGRVYRLVPCYSGQWPPCLLSIVIGDDFWQILGSVPRLWGELRLPTTLPKCATLVSCTFLSGPAPGEGKWDTCHSHPPCFFN